METNIESRINEAEVCRSMGLYGDSLDIYESILSLVSSQDAHVQATIQKRIHLLKNEIGGQKETQPYSMDISAESTPEKISSSKVNIPEILDSATAFQEMGLYPEAITEYGKLFKENYPNEKEIPLITESLLKLYSPVKAVEEFNKLVCEQNPTETNLGHVKFLLGQELEKREHRDQAYDLYKEAIKLDPTNTEISKRLVSLLERVCLQRFRLQLQ